jgi:hypothetical protein
MDYKTHMTIGIITSLIIASILYFTTDLIQLNVQTLIMGAIIMYVYPLLPDIDTRASTIVWSFLGVGILGITIAILNNYYHFLNNGTTVMIASCILLIGTFSGPFIGHRGFIHSISFGAIASAAIYFIVPSVGLVIMAFCCFYSHLVCDGLWNKLM